MKKYNTIKIKQINIIKEAEVENNSTNTGITSVILKFL